MRKILSLILCLLLTSAVGLPSRAADGPETRGAGLRQEAPHGLENLPAGFHDTGTVYESEKGDLYYYLESEPSESGWIEPLWIDARGNAMDSVFEPFLGQTELPSSSDSAPRRAPALPAAYDARAEGLVTPVRHQNSGTCWMFAAVAVMEANAIKKGLATSETIDLSEYHLVRNSLSGYYPGVTDAANDGDAPSSLANALNNGGNYNKVARSVLNFSGPVSAANYALESETTFHITTDKVAADLRDHIFYADKFDRDYVVTSIKTVSRARNSIKNAVLTYGACQVTAYDLYEREEEASDSSEIYPHPYYRAETAAYYRPETGTHTHAMAVVGWDDAYSRENFCEEYRPASDGAWLLKNSWGPEFGDGGYIWVSYEDPNVKTPVVYEVETAADWQNVYLYDGRGSAAAVEAEAAANVFRANGNELLTKVSHGTNFDESQQYTFEIYALPDDYADPTDGTLLYTQTSAGNGLKFLALDEPVALAAGGAFSVVFRGEGAYATEKKSTSSLKFQSGKRQSYYLSEGGWKDSGGTNLNNVCIRAVTLNTEPSFKVTFACPGWRTRVRTSTGTVPLPEAEPGMQWVLTCGGKPFDGTGITADTTVTAHYYPVDGADHICYRDYSCVHCGKAMQPRVTTAEHVWEVERMELQPTCEEGGYSWVICRNCGTKSTEQYAALGHADPDDDGVCDRCGTRLRPEDPVPDENACKYCGQTHTGAFGSIIGFFHRILYFFRNLFRS